MIGSKTRLIIILLGMAYIIPLITRRDFYPIQTFPMFALSRNESVGVAYIGFARDKSGQILKIPEFKIWPVRTSDFNASIDRWVQTGVEEENYPKLNRSMLKLLQAERPQLELNCFGVMKVRWPLEVSPDRRLENLKFNELAEYCDEK